MCGTSGRALALSLIPSTTKRKIWKEKEEFAYGHTNIKR
jgi:hypothetical protein